jgi:RNA polymerase sigma factor (sigma-70 family)
MAGQNVTDLALENLRFGRYMMAKTGANSWDMDDLVQESYLGMRCAQRKFDPARGTFTTYSRAWIRQHAMKWRDLMAYPVRIPDSDLPQAGVVRGSHHQSIDEPVTDDGRTLAELMPDRASNVDDRLDVELLLRKLPARDQRVIELRYLLDWPVERVAREMGLQPQSVHKAIRRSLALMRE